MPRYKTPAKNKRPLRTWHPVLRIGLMAVSVLVVIAVATVVVKRIVRRVPPVYGGTVGDQFLSKRALISKVNAMQTTIDSYNAQLSTLSQLQIENNALKAELGRSAAPVGTIATVMTLPNRSIYDTFLIDAGSAEGIKQGMVVSAFGSVALGTVSSVDLHDATVQLYSAPTRQTSGTAVGTTVAVTLIGHGGGEYEVQLPRDVPFNVGDTVALQSTTPSTLATIEKIITDPRDPFQRLLAKAPVNLQALKWVVVR